MIGAKMTMDCPDATESAANCPPIRASPAPPLNRCQCRTGADSGRAPPGAVTGTAAALTPICSAVTAPHRRQFPSPLPKPTPAARRPAPRQDHCRRMKLRVMWHELVPVREIVGGNGHGSQAEEERWRVMRPSFGARLRELRELCGLSQENLAEASGQTRQDLASWEAGDQILPFDAMQTICDALSVPCTVFDGCEAAPVGSRVPSSSNKRKSAKSKKRKGKGA